MTWNPCALGQVMALQRGPDLPDAQRQDGDVPMVSSSEVTGRHSIAKARAPGVVTGRHGTLGEVCYIDEVYWPLDTALYVTDFKGSHPRFVAYLLKYVVRNLQGDEAAVPRVNRNPLHALEVQCPGDVGLQESIASRHSAYEDRIENNRRRMALLEEAARQLYREWFVRLCFPGHEHTRMRGGSPAGWVQRRLGDSCAEIRDSVKPSDLEAETAYIGLEHMPRRSISLDAWGAVEEGTSDKHRFRRGDILFGRIRPYFHEFGVAFVDGVASSDTIVIRPLDSSTRALVLMTVSSDQCVALTSQAMRAGSKMPRADGEQMQAYPVSLPPRGLSSGFEKIVSTIVTQLGTLAFAREKLRAARDLVFPRLMSGELAV